jgi:hypothetical protein
MKIIAWAVSFAIFVLGLYLMGLAFSLTTLQPETFIAGLLAMTAGFFIPIHIVPKISDR